MRLERVLAVQQQDVDVGGRQDPAAAVAADGDERQAVGHFRQESAPRFVQHFVDQERAGAHQRVGGGAFLEHAVEPVAAPVQRVAESAEGLGGGGGEAGTDPPAAENL